MLNVPVTPRVIHILTAVLAYFVKITHMFHYCSIVVIEVWQRLSLDFSVEGDVQK